MKTRIAIVTLLMALLTCCNNVKPTQQFAKVTADSLIANIDKYENTKVEIEGVIIHICGVDGKKMKLRTENGSIIKIVPYDSLQNFDVSFIKSALRFGDL